MRSVKLSELPFRVGWVPVDYGDAQISIPASYSVFYPGENSCRLFTTPGALFVGPRANVGPSSCPAPLNPKNATTVDLSPLSTVSTPKGEKTK